MRIFDQAQRTTYNVVTSKYLRLGGVIGLGIGAGFLLGLDAYDNVKEAVAFTNAGDHEAAVQPALTGFAEAAGVAACGGAVVLAVDAFERALNE